jgi:hypothetical protein
MVKEVLALPEQNATRYDHDEEVSSHTDSHREGRPGSMNWSPFQTLFRLIGKSLFTYTGSDVHPQRVAYTQEFNSGKANAVAFETIAKISCAHIDALTTSTAPAEIDDIKYAMTTSHWLSGASISTAIPTTISPAKFYQYQIASLNYAALHGRQSGTLSSLLQDSSPQASPRKEKPVCAAKSPTSWTATSRCSNATSGTIPTLSQRPCVEYPCKPAAPKLARSRNSPSNSHISISSVRHSIHYPQAP